MLKVMLIGDSIRMSYHNRVREVLGTTAQVQGPAENCRFAAYTLFGLSGWVPDDDYDVIHWNNGQWDVCHMPDGRIHTSLSAYLELEQRIAQILQRKAKRVIFATTSPVHEDMFRTAAVNGRTNADIEAYNAAAAEKLSAMGVEINDLHAPLAQDVTRYISHDKVHLTPAGVELCASLVAQCISGPIGRRTVSP